MSSTLFALNKHRYNIPIVLFALILDVAIDVTLIRGYGMGLVAVAIGSAVAYTVYWFIHTTLVKWFFVRRVPASMWSVVKMGWPGYLLATFAAASVVRSDLASSAPAWELLVGGSIAAAAVIAFLVNPGVSALRAMREDGAIGS